MEQLRKAPAGASTQWRVKFHRCGGSSALPRGSAQPRGTLAGVDCDHPAPHRESQAPRVHPAPSKIAGEPAA